MRKTSLSCFIYYCEQCLENIRFNTHEIHMLYTQVFKYKNFPYKKTIGGNFHVFGYARELYNFIEGTGVGRQSDHNKIAPIERL